MLDKEKLKLSLEIISDNYKKVLLVNLTDYTFEAVKIPDDELPFITNNKIIDYWNWFCNSELIHNDDRQACIEYGSKVKFGTHLVYRRKVNDAYRWVLMELTNPKKCNDNTEYCVCYVRDIHNIYLPEYEALVERIGTTDSMTGLYNKVAFERDREKFKNERVGIVYVDINGLKYTNDNNGHRAGDELILKLASLLSFNFGNFKCYHLSGDEFAVCAFNVPFREFLTKAIGFHKSVWVGMEIPIASVGYSVGEPGEFDETLAEAEREMYDDKRIFYSRFPKYKRK